MPLMTPTAIDARPGSPQVARLDDLADAVLRQALAVACQRSGAARGSDDFPSLLTRPDFPAWLELALAAGVAGVLGLHDPRIVAVYGYQPALPGCPALEATGTIAIRLLIVVTAPSAALQSFVESLQRALAASWHALPAVRPWQRELVLDANVIAQPAFESGLGLASLLSAAPAAPIRLWSGTARANA